PTGFGAIKTVGVDGVAAFWLAEHGPLGEPLFEPEHVQDTELPAEGKEALLGEPLKHCSYGL
ncbi:MAG: hypothetical protein AAB835_00905, partial [Patescibacteria group bacterium]